MTATNKIDNNIASIEDQVKQIIAEHLKIELNSMQQNSSFTNDLGADSLDLVELIMQFEDKFNIEIPDEDAEKITNVQEAINYIKNHVGQDQEN